MVVSTDAACMLTVNGIAQPEVLVPASPRSIDAPPGDASIECISTTVPSAKLAVVQPVVTGETRTLTLQLAPLVVNASCAGKPSTLADLGHGVLRHCVTGTDWAQTDVGTDTGWNEAVAWCAQKGTGWVLASADELAELIDRSGGSSIKCGMLTCNVSSLFRLSAPGQWSGDVSGAQMRLLVNMIYGQRHQSNVNTTRGYRAMCVRRP